MWVIVVVDAPVFTTPSGFSDGGGSLVQSEELSKVSEELQRHKAGWGRLDGFMVELENSRSAMIPCTFLDCAKRG